MSLLMVFMQLLLLTTLCKLSGGIPILVAALDSLRTPAINAIKAMDRLLLHHELPSEQVEAVESVLIKLQAVPRLCKLLPPDIPGWTGDGEDEVQGRAPCSMLPGGLPCPALLCPGPLVLSGVHLYDSMTYDVLPCEVWFPSIRYGLVHADCAATD